ncbi:Two-component response regulator [Enhygromyxa salina]|uniref:Two-component response regulator n=1 Tax=Enhygromyxa salina TaxID=215803 RepID=A0A0C2D6X7_9BACT|nr:response regulator [Enhygromyxa salina]KIG18951.1 Two-component response regulator [Enhygromyxa salina]
MSGPPSAKPPIFKIGFESYDDFLVEYGDHLRKGVLMLPAAMGLGPGQDVRIKLVLPNHKVLYLKGCTRDHDTGSYAALGPKAGADEIQVQLASFSAEQSQALESCVSGALATDPKAVAPEESGPINLLLVDDSVGVRIELGDALRDRGLRVRVAENGLVAIAAALKRPPEIILSDVEMPVMDGWTFLRMTRARQRLAHIPFVFFTRLTDDLSRLQAYRMGVEDFLSKDTGADEVLARLHGVLARHKNRPQPVAASALGQTGQGLRGDLEHVKLGSLMSFLESEKRSGRLLLDNGRDQAVLEINRGSLAGVENLGNYSHAHDRVFELLEWQTGNFEFAQADDSDMPEPAGELTQLTYLLMEHARRADEAANPNNG